MLQFDAGADDSAVVADAADVAASTAAVDGAAVDIVVVSGVLAAAALKSCSVVDVAFIVFLAAIAVTAAISIWPLLAPLSAQA